MWPCWNGSIFGAIFVLSLTQRMTTICGALQANIDIITLTLDLVSIKLLVKM